MNCNSLIFILLFVLVGFYFCTCKKKERYANVYYNKDLDEKTLSRPTFNSNLDPRNMNVRSDPFAYSGLMKGNSPDVENLASYNKISTSREGFRPVSRREGFDAVPSQESGHPVSSGRYTAGMNDALSYVEYIDSDYDGLPTENQTSQSGNNDFSVLDNDFATETKDGTFRSAQVQSSTQKYKSSLSNKTDTLKYTTPSELLPAPDMRQPLMRDPSDPSNFMYDRTIFAPLKKRNRNEADRIRGDLDIEPIKTGYFDVASTPHIDLVKGYFGYYNDIQQYQDIQDISYARQQREETGEDPVATQKLTATMSAVNSEMLRPSLKYASAPKLDFGPLNSSYSKDNAWYNTVTGSVSNRQLQL